MAKQLIELSLAPGAGEALAQAVRAVIEQYGAVAPAGSNPNRPDVEPWVFHSPSAACDVVAYLDDHNQIRHVPVTRTVDIPGSWRRVFVERRG